MFTGYRKSICHGCTCNNVDGICWVSRNGNLNYGQCFLYPSVQDGVKLTDHLGMQERLMTALEFEDSQEAAITSQREDTLLHIEDITKRPSYSIKIWRRPWLIAGILFVGTLGVLMVPTSSSKQAAQIEELQEKIIEEMAWIEEKLDQDLLEEKLADAADIEEKEKAIEEALEALKENIEKAKSEEEALKRTGYS